MDSYSDHDTWMCTCHIVPEWRLASSECHHISWRLRQDGQHTSLEQRGYADYAVRRLRVRNILYADAELIVTFERDMPHSFMDTPHSAS